MREVMFRLWDICIFKGGPDRLPSSVNLVLLFCVLRIALQLINPIAELGFQVVYLAISVVETGLTIVGLYVVLRIRDVVARLPQTLTAWLGTDLIVAAFILIGLMFLPILSGFVVLLFGLLVVWRFGIYAFILSRAINVSIAAGVGIALGLAVVITLVGFALFGVEPYLGGLATQGN